MKKIFFIVLLLTVMTTVSQAQRYDFLYLNFSAGPSFPIGEFASNDINNPGSGYAKIGGKGEISLGINLTPTIGLMTEFFLSSNGTNVDNYSDYLNTVYTGYNWGIESKRWNIYGIFTGLSFRTPIKKDVFVFIRAYGGYINSKSPGLIFTGDSGNVTGTLEIESSSTSAMTYKLTGGLEFKTDDRFSVCGIIEYIGSKPKFNNVKTSTNFFNNATGTYISSGESKSSFDQTLSLFNIGIGFKYFIY
jgi:subtilisin family serine protease